MPHLSEQEVFIIDTVDGWTYSGKVEVGEIKEDKDNPESKLYLYTTQGNTKKNLAFPVDMFAYCDPVPYINTPTGSLRFFIFALLAVISGYTLLLALVINDWMSGLQFGIPQVSSQFVVNIVELSFTVAIPVISYFYVQLKHHFVSKWEIEPYQSNTQDYKTTEFYIPVNTSKNRTTQLIKKLENIEQSNINELITALHAYESELIEIAQDDARKYKESLETFEIKTRNRGFDLDASVPSMFGVTWWKISATIALTIVLSVGLTLMVV